MRTLPAVILALLPLPALAQFPALAQMSLPATDDVAARAEALATKQAAAPKRTLALHLEVAGALTRGNTDTAHLNTSLNLTWAFADGWLSTTTAQALYEEATLPPGVKDGQATDTAVNWLASQRVDRYFDHLGAFAGVAVDRNPFAGIGIREAGQLGVILVAVEDKLAGEKPGDELVQDRLQFEAGGYLAEETHDAIPHSGKGLPPGTLRHQTIEASRLGTEYVHRFKKGSDTGAKLEYIQDFKDTKNVVVQGQAYVASAFTEILSLKVTLTDRWDNQPAPAIFNNDLLLTAGLLVNL